MQKRGFLGGQEPARAREPRSQLSLRALGAPSSPPTLETWKPGSQRPEARAGRKAFFLNYAQRLGQSAVSMKNVVSQSIQAALPENDRLCGL